MSDLFGNHIVGFSTRRLKCIVIDYLTKLAPVIIITQVTKTKVKGEVKSVWVLSKTSEKLSKSFMSCALVCVPCPV